MSSRHRFVSALFIFATAAFFPSCKSTTPGSNGEPCNADSIGVKMPDGHSSLDGCDAVTQCVSGTCEPMSSAGGGSSPLFYSCASTANCVANSLCVDQGYCKPLCTSDSDCTKYPYANLTCRPVPGASGSVCDDQSPTLFGGNPSGGGGTCASGSTYCASCNVCLPQGCSYWCQEGAQGGCASAPSGLTGCTGPVHTGCDCGGGGSCTPSCAGRACGSDGCGGSCGTCPSGSSCSSSGTCAAGGGGGSCVNVNSYVSTKMSANAYCKDYVVVTNAYSHQIACKYTTSNGKSGCVYASTGTNDCSFWLNGAASYSMVCADGQLACDQAIGCSL